MNWKALSTFEDLEGIIEKSSQQPVLIYKHSTSCPLSSVVRSRLEHSWKTDPLDIEAHLLDLISFREVSNAVEDQFKVRHQSPQVLVIDQGKCIFHCSHLAIGLKVIKKALHQITVEGSN